MVSFHAEEKKTINAFYEIARVRLQKWTGIKHNSSSSTLHCNEYR